MRQPRREAALEECHRLVVLMEPRFAGVRACESLRDFPEQPILVAGFLVHEQFRNEGVGGVLDTARLAAAGRVIEALYRQRYG